MLPETLQRARHHTIQANVAINRALELQRDCTLGSADQLLANIDAAHLELKIATTVMDHLRTTALALLLLFGLAACDGGSDSVSMTGTQKCTVTINGKEEPCQKQP